MSLENLFRKLSEQLKIEFEECAGLIPHPAESGRAREVVLAEFLEKCIPKRFSVDSGFIIDAVGGRGQQVDIIVYDSNYGPS